MMREPVSIPPQDALAKLASPLQRTLNPLALAASMLCALLLFGLGLWITVAAPTYVRGVESNVLFTIQKHLSGQSLYTNPNDLPYDVAQYMPLYYLLCGTVARLFGISAKDPYTLSVIARGISLICSVLIALVLYRIQVKTLGISPRFALAATSFAYASCSPWLFLARPDALMDLLLIASVLALLQTDHNHSLRRVLWLIAAAALAVAAIATKQNGIIAVAILFGTLLVSGRILERVIAVSFVLLVGAVLLFAALTVWPHFLQNVVDGVNNGIGLSNAIEKTYGRTLSNFAFPLALGLYVVSRWATMPREYRTLSHNTLVVAVCLAFANAILTGLKEGSGEGYFNEAILFMSVAVSWYLFSKSREHEHDFTPDKIIADVPVRLVACFLLLFLPIWTGKQWYDYYYFRTKTPASLGYPVTRSFASSDFKTVADDLRLRLAETPDGVVFSWERAMNNFLPEYCILPQQEVVELMRAQGVIDLSNFESCVRAGRLRYVLSVTEELPVELFGVPLPAAHLVYQVGNLRVFEFDAQ